MKCYDIIARADGQSIQEVPFCDNPAHRERAKVAAIDIADAEEETFGPTKVVLGTAWASECMVCESAS